MNVFEKLKPSQYRDLVKGWDKSRYADLFKIFKHDKNAYRIFLPLKEPSKTSSPVMQEINTTIASSGYQIKDYSRGIASNGKREIRLGKLIANNPELTKKFANDPARAASTQQDGMQVIISRHPYDIGGMSTDRGWTSCMNLKDGINNHYVPLDVESGTIIAYLVKSGDENIESPVARVLIKPFIHETDPNQIIFGIENRIYGTAPDTFVQTVKAWVNKVNKSKALQGVFLIHPEVYQDFHDGDVIRDEEYLVRASMVLPKGKRLDKQTQEKIYIASVELRPYSIAAIKNPSEQVQLAAVRRYGYAIMHIDNPTEKVQLAAVEEIGGEDAMRNIKNPTETAQLAAVKNQKGAIKQIKNPTERVKRAAGIAETSESFTFKQFLINETHQ